MRPIPTLILLVYNIWYQSQMTNNLSPTRSTTNDDCMSALEVSNHSLSRQVEAQKEEFASLRNGKDALTDAIA